MNCILKLNALVFDNIIFKRSGIYSEEQLEVSFTVSIGVNEVDSTDKKVSVKIIGEKKDEFSFEVQASGYFSYEGDVEDTIIQRNAVAIILPYLRSEVSLLTAQPGMEPVVIPPLNVEELLDERE